MAEIHHFHPNESRNVSLNASLTDFTDPDWNFLAVYNLIMFFAIIFTNGPVLYVYLTNPQLISNTFSYYLINLLTSNIVHAFLEVPLDVVLALYVGKQKGGVFCTALLYGIYIPDGLMMQSHVLITLNRVWAVGFPHGYRIFHTKKVALLLCGWVWFYVHILMIPGLSIDFTRYRYLPSADNVQCLINATESVHQKIWSICEQLLLYACPICVVLTAYPFIWWKTFNRKRQAQETGQRTWNTSENSIRVSRKKTMSVGLASEPRTEALQAVKEVPAERKKSMHSFTILTVLTVSAVLCWTPLVCFYVAVTLFDYNMPLLYSIGIVPWSLQPALDPVLFAVVLTDLRVAALKRFQCW